MGNQGRKSTQHATLRMLTEDARIRPHVEDFKHPLGAEEGVGRGAGDILTLVYLTHRTYIDMEQSMGLGVN